MPENDYELDFRIRSRGVSARAGPNARLDSLQRPEPEVDLDGTSIAAHTLFDRMTKLGLDQMPAIEIQVTCETLAV